MGKTIAVDFDGVINTYSKGWNGGVIEEPIEGAIEGLIKLVDEGYRVVIFTTRLNTEEFPENKSEVVRIRNWLVRQLVDKGMIAEGSTQAFPFHITSQKPAAIAYIDDRAIRFTNWPDMLKYFL